jgi:hypothetical protein
MKIENRHVNYGRFDSRDLFGERAGISGMSMREMIARDQATHGLVEKQASEPAGRGAQNWNGRCQKSMTR